MAKTACKYPNLAAEMSRKNLNYRSFYEEIANQFDKSSDTIANWIAGRAGELPTKVAFAIRDQYFPDLSIEYLFSETPIQIDELIPH